MRSTIASGGVMSAFQSQFRIRSKWGFIALFALALFVLAAHRVSAQVEKGVITGRVRESTGSIVQNAQVTLQNTATGRPTLTSTNSEGIYVSPPLSPGDYEVKVAAAGFAGSAQHVRLAVGQRLSVDATLTIGPAVESVQVLATTVQFDTDNATVSNLRTEE